MFVTIRIQMEEFICVTGRRQIDRNRNFRDSYSFMNFFLFNAASSSNTCAWCSSDSTCATRIGCRSTIDGAVWVNSSPEWLKLELLKWSLASFVRCLRIPLNCWVSRFDFSFFVSAISMLNLGLWRSEIFSSRNCLCRFSCICFD